MSDEPKQPRKPFGERDEEERSQPFGARPPRRADKGPEKDVVSPYTPYTARPGRPRLDPLPPLDLDPEPAPAAPPAPEPETEPFPDLFEPDPLPSGPPLRPGGDLQYESYRQPGRSEHTPLTVRFSTIVRSLGVMVVSAALLATMFTWWTPNSFLPVESSIQLAIAQATQAMQAVPTSEVPPSPFPTAAPPLVNNVGIVSGHRGIHPDTGLPDPGAVCEDGLTEHDVNEAVATRVQALLEAQGYQVDLLDEFDARLSGYRALAMVSIHADSCEYINDLATGFKVASFEASSTPEQDQRLVNCLIERYGEATGLPFHPSITYDMTRYHNFAEVDVSTPGVIIEIGFLYLDRALLTGSPDAVAQGIAGGILCYLRNEPPGGSDGEPETP